MLTELRFHFRDKALSRSRGPVPWTVPMRPLLDQHMPQSFQDSIVTHAGGVGRDFQTAADFGKCEVFSPVKLDQLLICRRQRCQRLVQRIYFLTLNDASAGFRSAGGKLVQPMAVSLQLVVGNLPGRSSFSTPPVVAARVDQDVGQDR